MPTKTCFDDSLDFMMELARNKKTDGVYVCHGIVSPRMLVPECKSTFTHAWVYDCMTDICLDWGILEGQRIGVKGSKRDYFHHMRVKEVTYYTFKQCMYYSWIYNFFGPWEPKYMVLCSDGEIKKRVSEPGFSMSKFKKHLENSVLECVMGVDK